MKREKEKSRRLKGMLVATVLVLVIASIASIIPTGAQGSNLVSIADVNIAAGGSKIVPIIIYNATGVASVGVKLSYNASVVNVTGATQGDFTSFFAPDLSNAANGWITINTFVIGAELTGDVKVADVTLEAVGNGGDSSPLNLEILSMADKFGNDLEGTTDNGTFEIVVDIGLPLVTNASADPLIIPDDTDNEPRCGELTELIVDVTDESAIDSVTVNLSAIGVGSEINMTNIGNYTEGSTLWCVFNYTTNASAGTAGWNGSAYVPYCLTVNATDIYGHSNTSVCINLTVMKNGDVTGNGVVNIGDAMLVANNVSYPGQGYILSSEAVAEVTGNCVVNIGDAMLIANNVSYPGQGYILR